MEWNVSIDTGDASGLESKAQDGEMQQFLAMQQQQAQFQASVSVICCICFIITSSHINNISVTYAVQCGYFSPSLLTRIGRNNYIL